MGVIQLLGRIFKLGLTNLSRLSTAGKLLLISGIAVFLKMYMKHAPQIITQMSFTQFFHPLNAASLSLIQVYPNLLMAKDKFSNILRVNRFGVPSNILFEELKKTGAVLEFGSGSKPGFFKTDVLILIFSFVLSAMVSYFVFSEKDKNKPSKPSDGVKFQDMIGLQSAKTALKEVIQFMINPEKYKKLGARMRRGVLLYGPPGTGKTTLAKACANQAGVPFYSCNAAQFCEIYVGMGPKKVRALFEKAKKNAPSVIFIDEVDAFGSRGNQFSYMESANSEKNSTINQMLSELDGFDSSDKVLVIGATNRLDVVDKSLTRAGRFDLKIHTSLPNLEERILIFKRYLKKTNHNITQEFLNTLLENWENPTGADIEALINESIYQSVRRSSELVESQDIINSLQATNLSKNVKNRN